MGERVKGRKGEIEDKWFPSRERLGVDFSIFADRE
jgi:hypothetical protein